jgi:VCBS repeat-containing protein
MSTSKFGSSTSVGDDAPLGDNSIGDQFNRFEVGNSAPAEGVGTSGPEIGIGPSTDDLGNPGPEIGISTPEIGIGTPADELGNPGIVIGISAPTSDDAVPADSAPAGDGASSGDGGASLEGLGTWESIDTLAIADEVDDFTNQKGGGASFDPMAANTPGSPGQLLTLGTNPDGSHFFTGIRNVDAVLIGSKWGTTNLTYSFPTLGSNYNGSVSVYDGVANYHLVLGAQQQAAARAAFAQLSALTGLTFTEITETDTVHANIRISQTADADVPSAYGTFPSDTVTAAGDIWFGRNNQPYYDLAYKGTWGFATMMHEIGHTMGLKHGHQDYTNLDLSSSFGTSPRFGTQSLTPDRDGQAWSLMTYTPAPFTNSGFAGEKINQPESYMQYDVAALQYLYGANFNTNSGDSVYTFNQTTGEMSINGVGQGAPSGNKIFLTIWDGGGNDTIDASNYANGVTIDLRPGEFSTVDQNQLANNLAYQNLVNLAPGNFAMSLLYNNDTHSLIENAKGGIGNDIFVGNTANNLLDGGAGSDTVIFTNVTGVNVTLNDTNADVIVNHDGETDTLRSIENIQGTIGNDILTGNSLNNTLSGGAGGSDYLSGGGGDDRLIGGGFTTTTTFSAPSQPDITKPQSTNNGSIATAVATAGFFDVDANPAITNASSMPHATINATASGGTVEYYRIDVTVAGSTAIFDIDGGGTLDDSILELVNSGGTLLATNDTGTGDVTFPGHDDAYLTFTFATVGTYYIRVGRFISNSVAQPLIAGQTYQLNISLDNAAAVTTTVTANNTSSVLADGGEGNDVILGTIANDTLIGGNGNDTASFVNAFSGGSTTGVSVNLNLQGGAQNTVAAGNDTLLGFENLIGSALNDTLTGDGNDNVIEGGLGNDTLVGGLGSDTASYAGAAAGVTVSLALQGSAQNTVNAGTDTLSGFENLAGSAFNDSLTGDANANILTGGAGDDTLNPGANAGGTVDLLDGGIGSDTASFAGNAAGVTATLNGASDGAATVGGLAIATLRSIENLTGSANADTLTGDSNANVIEGGLGNDILDGGLGVDTLAFSGATAVTVNLATTTAQNTGWGSDTIVNFENVRTGSGADNVIGDANANTFFDGGGNDTYDGAGGVDTVDYSAATSTVTVNLNTATAQNTGTSGGTDTITNIENIVGSAAFANTLTGNTLANTLTGGSAVDTIQGNNGNDVIFGGAGNDILLGGTSGALDDGSADTLEGGAGADFLGGGQGNDILRGGDGDDTLVGGVVNTSNQFFTGVDGGDDTYDGGDGADRAIMVYDTRAGVGASTVGIAFDIGNLAGNSNITWNGVVVGSLTSIEFVTFRGSNVNDVVKGGGSLDSLTGGAGDDVLDGWLGNDLLSGGLGNDTLIGGEGVDTVTYANSTAGVNVDLRIQGVAQNTGGEGIDTLSGIEYLVGSNFADTLRGDDNFNLITDTTISFVGQTDSFFGYGGNDSILVTRTQGATSNVNMDGGDGDDFIELRSGTLSVALAVNLDGVVASPTGASQTYMALGTTGSGAAANLDVVTVDGGAGNDRIVLSGVASATINAGSGNDTVSISMRGASSVNNYQITLGSGADILQLGVGSNAANSTDVAVTARTSRVTDFEVGNAGDKFEMTNFLNFGLTGYTANSNAFADGHLRLTQSGSDLLVQVDRDGAGVTNGFVTIFAISNGYTGGFTAFNFDGFIGNLNLTGIGSLNETITGATGNDVLSGGDGNDVLIGLAGTDTLDGGNGDDLLLGGTGNDTLIGGAGSDTASYSDATGGVTVNLSTAGAQNTVSAGSDTLSGIENLTGSAFSDSLTGDTGANRMMGGAGSDGIAGGAGHDEADFAGNRAGYSFTYTTDANGYVTGFTSVTDTDGGNGDEGTDTLTGIEQLQFADMAFDLGQPVQLFDASNNLVGTFTSIQAAVAAAQDNYTVIVGTGTYTEQVHVDNIDNLTIKAAAGADVTIMAPGSLATYATHAAGHLAGVPVYAVVTVANSTGFTMNGIDVNGAGAGGSIANSNDDFVGVFFRNASGSVLGADISGIHDPYGVGTTVDGHPVISGNQRGSGVEVDNDSLMAFTMTGGSISDFQKNAGRFWNGDVDISGVTVTGGGAQTGPAQNGFVVESGTGSISGNTLTAIGYAGTQTVYSVIIYVRGADNLDVTDNVITGTNGVTLDAKVLGIAYYDDNAANVGGHVTGNTISWTDTGIDIEGDVGSPAIVVNSNTVTNIDFTDAFSPAGVYFTPTDTTAYAFDVTGSGVHDYLAGGAAGDTFTGLGGNDEFQGNGGNDVIHGDGGTDTATYGGPRADYTITYTTDANGFVTGFTSVADTNGATNGDDGSDTLTSIERLQFNGLTLDLTQVQLFDASDNLVGTYATIQAAINASSDSYTIRVPAGTFAESLTVNHDITILGANVGTAGSGSRGAETVITGNVTIAADGVTINGVEITGAGAGPLGTTGVVVDSGSDSFSLVNSVLHGTGDFAMFVGGVTGLDVGANRIDGYSIGMYIATGGTTGSVHGNLFQGDGAGSGTGLQDGLNSETTHVTISGNTFDGIDGGSLFLFPSGPDTIDLDTYITGNTITDSGIDRPVQILPTNLTHNVIGTDYNEAFDGETAALAGVTGSFSFDGQGGDDKAWGGQAGDTLTGGTGNDTLYGEGGDDTLSGGIGNDSLNGNLGGTGDPGIDTATYAGARAGYSVVTTTNGNGVVTGFTSVTDTNAGNGDEGTDTLTSIEHLQFADVTLDLALRVQLFDGSNQLVGTFNDIQAAIDAASDGYRIHALAGTYAESLNVNKDVTIEGANVGTAGTGTRGAETIITGNVTIAADGVTVNGVEITGAGAGPLGTTGVVVGSGSDSFSLVNSVLHGTGDFAMFVGGVTGLDVGANRIDGYSIGMYIATGGTTGSVHGNLFQGDLGPTTGLGNGVNSETTHVTISGNTFDGIYAGSLNLFPFGPDSVDLNSYISGNTITHSGAARPVQILPTDLTHNVIGTDYNEAFDGETAAANGVTGAFTFDGRGGNDHVWGGNAGDTFTGGTGNDELHGNGGTDNAIYSGNRSDYTVTLASPGVIQIVDNRGGSPDGTDLLDGVERIVFANNDYWVENDGTLTVINDAPLGVDHTLTFIEDVVHTFSVSDFSFTDTEGNALLEVKIVDLPLAGTIYYDADGAGTAFAPVAISAGQTFTAADLTAGRLTFVSAPNANGAGYASFTYQVRDNGGTAHGGADTDPVPNTITIDVTPVNDAPTVVADTNGGDPVTEAGVNPGNTAFPGDPTASGNVLTNDSDVDGDPISVSAVAGGTVGAPLAGTYGSVTINSDGSYVYTLGNGLAATNALSQGQAVTDVFTVSVSDNHGATSTTTLTINITGTNDAPDAVNDTASGNEDSGPIIGSVATNDTDADTGATRTYALNAPVAGLTLVSNGIYSFDTSNAAYQHLAAGATQVVTATYTATDDHGATDTATLTITLTGTNDAPVAVADIAVALEDAAPVTGNVGTNDSDADDGATRTYTLAAPVAGLTLNNDGSYSFNPANAAYQHLALGATQTVTANYTLTDDQGATANSTLTIIVIGTNDAPHAVADTQAATEDAAVVNGSLATNDSDADDGATLSYTLLTPVAGLTLNANGSYSFNPANASYQSVAAGDTRILVASYRVTDQFGATGTSSLTITVTGVNDGPVAVVDTNSGDAVVAAGFHPGNTVFAGDALAAGNVLNNDTDIDSGDTKSVLAVAGDSLNVGNAVTGTYGSLTLLSDGSYTYTLDNGDADTQALGQGASATDQFTYTMQDNHGGTSTTTLTITVTGTNDAPVGVADTNSGDAVTEAGLNPGNTAFAGDATASGNVLTNDTDIDSGDSRTVSQVNGASLNVGNAVTGTYGSVTIASNGSYTYTLANADADTQALAEGETVTDQFTYTLVDADGATSSTTLTITVTGTNDAPVVQDVAVSASEDGLAVTASFAGDDVDSDDDGSTLTYSAPIGPSEGLVINNGDGTFSFDPATDFQDLALGETRDVTFGYVATDSHGAESASGTITVTVHGANDAPTGSDDTDTATEDGAPVTGNVGTNDVDVDHGATLGFALNAAAPAGLTFNPDGSYSFDPTNAAYQHLAAGATQNVAATYTVTDEHGATGVATLTITVTGIDDAPVVHPDAVATNEATVLNGSVFSNNGSGADSDVDSPLTVSAVNGSGANVGTQITLASGAHLTLNADGTFSYDPNHAFDATPAAGSGASNTTAPDSFSYTLAGGGTATVSITINGVDSNDVLLGTAGADSLNGGIGADSMSGGLGNDSYFVDNAGDTVIEAAGQGSDHVFASVNYTLGAGQEIELFTATNPAATTALNLTGNALGQTIGGNAGANVLTGGGGNDVLAGFGGDDVLNGNADAASTLIGGTGDDTYFVSRTGDSVIEAAGEGNDRVRTSVSFTLGAGQSVEMLSAVNPAATTAINLTGNALGQVIIGNEGANILTGGGGNDYLAGAGGNDILVGNADAASTLQGGTGDDWYYVTRTGDSIIEFAGEGNDRILTSVNYTLSAGQEIETLSALDPAATTAVSLTGNGLSQVIDGNEGANTLTGGGGSDYIVGGGGDDVIVGNADASSTLQGGTGDDWYYISRTGDSLVEFAGEGNDRILTSVSYTLSAGQEIETLSTVNQTGTAAIDLIGNDFAQVIFGNNGVNGMSGNGGADQLAGFGGDDILLGGDGNDQLNGGLGHDILNGGNGADLFVFADALGGGNVDTIQDFASGSDRIALDHGVFGGLSTGALSAGAFFAGAAAHDADDRIIYNQATGQLWFDADGNGAGAAVLFATLGNQPVIAASDFVVI